MPAHTYQAYYGKESGEAWRTFKMTGSVLGGLQGFLFNTGLGKKLPAALNNIKRGKTRKYLKLTMLTIDFVVFEIEYFSQDFFFLFLFQPLSLGNIKKKSIILNPLCD